MTCRDGLEAQTALKSSKEQVALGGMMHPLEKPLMIGSPTSAIENGGVHSHPDGVQFGGYFILSFMLGLKRRDVGRGYSKEGSVSREFPLNRDSLEFQLV